MREGGNEGGRERRRDEGIVGGREGEKECGEGGRKKRREGGREKE